MTRHTTFRYRLEPTAGQEALLARHAGASRFGYNQCLRLHRDARHARDEDPQAWVPWSGFDLITTFNAWKKSADAGRVIVVDGAGTAQVIAIGLPWRSGVCQQVFEEAAVDLGTALKAWRDARRAPGRRRRVGYPRAKKKSRCTPSFQLRNKFPGSGRPAIRVGDGHPRSVTLPRIGALKVSDNTRPLRRMIALGRGRVLYATVSRSAGRWWISLNVEAADLHPARRYRPQAEAEKADWVGVDRGLSAFVVGATSDGTEVIRVDAEQVPKPLADALGNMRRLGRVVARRSPGSRGRALAAAQLRRLHHRISCVRKHFLHWSVNQLVKTHDRVVIEDLHVAGMLRNHRLARAISDASWAEFARILAYKQAWRGGQLAIAGRWFPSSKTCSGCGVVRVALALAERTYACGSCGLMLDRDLNAAVNLAVWAEKRHRTDHPQTRDPRAGGPVTNAHGRAGLCLHRRAGETVPDDMGTGDPAAPAA